MNRPRSFSVLAALLALAVAFAACGDDNGDGGGAGGGDAQAAIDDATFEGIESGVLDLSLAADVEGKEAGNFDLSLSGPFQGAMEKGEKPQFDLVADVDGSFGDEKIDFEGGLVLLPNSAYVDYEGIDYEVDPTTFGIVESALKQAEQQGAAGSGSPTACQEAASGLEIGNFIDNLSDDGSADVEGTSTTKISGDLDVSGALDALIELAEDPACSAQVGAAGALPSESEIDAAKSEVSEAVKTAHVDVYVGEDDIVRQVSAQLEIAPEGGSQAGAESVSLDFELKLAGVNEEQEVSAPGGAKPLNDLFLKLGVNPIELLELLQGGGGVPDIGGLLEGLDGGGSGRSGGSGNGEQAELECLGEARTPVDIQKCLRLAG
ncbi:MAG TPA: hypothetical protein VFU04_09930 [Solirubrobacterales bacterium]|nr:hypothetical protein [Solirubrobacterales bacterium]